MARFHVESEDELPDLSMLMRPKPNRTTETRSPQKSDPCRPKASSATAKEESSLKKSKQRPLRKLETGPSLFGPFVANKDAEKSISSGRTEARKSPRKLKKPSKPIDVFQDEDEKENLESDASLSPADDSYHFSDGVGSDEESYLGFKRSQESPFKKLLKSRREGPLRAGAAQSSAGAGDLTDKSNPFLGPRIAPPVTAAPHSPPRPTSSSSAFDQGAILHYTPPKRISPTKKSATSRLSTPPLEPPSPSKKLHSPTKAQFAAIPPAPVHENLDEFWSQDVVNDWNEQYSPKKIVASPRKNRFTTPPASDDEKDAPSPSTSPRKARSPQKNRSPVKSKEARVMKKTWDIRKKELAMEFFKELDDTIAKGQLSEMTANTGGVQLIWSKKLNSTAGRANWRREKIREPRPDGLEVISYRHTANIELAEKVIDDEVRLINVMAHEFCHLCNFMISGIRDAPHGKEFKEWAKKCSRAFGSRGIEVTTKHSYDIDYKYVWECVECQLEFKRHSKSINPLQQACGACKGRLVQTKPPVRETKVTEYQLFIKEHCQRIKKENPGMAHGAVMEILGRSYREEKEKKSSDLVATEKVDVDSIVKELEIITLDD